MRPLFSFKTLISRLINKYFYDVEQERKIKVLKENKGRMISVPRNEPMNTRLSSFDLYKLHKMLWNLNYRPVYGDCETLSTINYHADSVRERLSEIVEEGDAVICVDRNMMMFCYFS